MTRARLSKSRSRMTRHPKEPLSCAPQLARDYLAGKITVEEVHEIIAQEVVREVVADYIASNPPRIEHRFTLNPKH